MPGSIFGPEGSTRSKQEAFKGSDRVPGWLVFESKSARCFGLPADEDAPLLSERNLLGHAFLPYETQIRDTIEW